MSETNSNNSVFKNKNIIDSLYTLSHIIAATIFVICLKKFNPKLLVLLLFSILGYIAYSEKNTVSIYIPFVFGIIIYIISNLLNDIKFKNIRTDLWQIPYWGIISYYFILCKHLY